MDIARTPQALEPLANQVKIAMQSVTDIARPGLFEFSWKKKTDELTVRNNNTLRSLPDTVRVSPSLAKQCVADEIAFMDKVDQIYNPGGIPKGLSRIIEVVTSAGNNDPFYTAYTAIRALVDTHRDDQERHRKYRESISQRHNTLGPILGTYALCQDNHGYFLKKSTWRTEERQVHTHQDITIDYLSTPANIGIDSSVDIHKLTNQLQKG